MGDYSISRQSPENTQIIPQALQVVNCSFASNEISQITNPTPSMSALKAPIYQTSPDKNDFMCGAGEICVANHSAANGGWNIPVRTALNGIVANGTTPAEQIANLTDDLVIVGVCLKTCIVNQRALSHTESPVAVVGGHVPVLNTSVYASRCGDILIACFPDPKMVTSQAPIDGSYPVTAIRRVVETVPLRCLMPKVWNGGYTKAEFNRLVPERKLTTLFKSKAFVDLVEFILINATHITDLGDNSLAGDARARGHLQPFDAAYQNERYAAGYVPGDGHVNAFRDSARKFQRRIVGLDGSHTIVGVDLFRHLLKISSFTTSLVASREIGRVTRGAPPGSFQGVTVTMGSFNAGKVGLA